MDDSLLDFSDEVQKIRRNFHHILPLSIREVVSPLMNDKDIEPASQANKKKKKSNQDTCKGKVENSGKIKNWIKSEEDYKSHICSY